MQLATRRAPVQPARDVTAKAAILLGTLGAWCALAPGCHRTDPGPALQIVGESTRVRLEDPSPASTPWLVDGRVVVIAARGETLGLQVLHRAPGATRVTLTVPGVTVRTFAVDSLPVRRASTEMYGGGRTGTFAEALTPDPAPTTQPAYVELEVAADAVPGAYTGELVVGEQHLPLALTISAVTLPPLAVRAWAYEDPRELAWAAGAQGDPPRATPSAAERACIALFRAHGVLLAPDLNLEWWPERAALAAGVRDLPVWIPDEPVAAAAAVRGWIAATRGTGAIPFAIPIDEPGTPEARAKVASLARAVRDAGGGPATFRFAVTDEPRPEYGDLVDLYISLRAPRTRPPAPAQWTYNGAPPRAGSMVLDAATPGTRTWGWIGWRWQIPLWYAWDALYWHDRHNRHGAPPPGRPLDVHADPVSFDAGEDHGNLDGVLALPAPGGCQRTLRLAALRRGLEDRALIELAAACDPAATERLVASLVPTALGDAPASGAPAWPTDEAAWELARRELIRIAGCAAR